MGHARQRGLALLDRIDVGLLLNLSGLLHALTMRLLHDVDPDALPDTADAPAA